MNEEIEKRLRGIDDSLREIAAFFAIIRREREKLERNQQEFEKATLGIIKCMMNNGWEDLNN